MVDAVSTFKAARVVVALRQSRKHRLNVLKVNRQEALAVTHCDTVESSADRLIEMGVGQVYVTMGSEGVYCSDGTNHKHFKAIPTRVINTTGAGDAFIAGVAHAMMQQVAFPDCAQPGLMAAHATLLSRQTVNPDINTYINH